MSQPKAFKDVLSKAMKACKSEVRQSVKSARSVNKAIIRFKERQIDNASKQSKSINIMTALTDIDEDQKIDRHPGGRPTLFNTRTVRRIKEYIDSCPEDEIPTVAGLACELKVDSRTLQRWYKDRIDNEFCRAYSLLHDTAHSKLVKNGLKGKFNAAITSLILKNNHGYSDNNQASTNIQVNVNRDKVKVQQKDSSIVVEG